MPVTAKDIARQLNLSQPTVSRILNGDPNHRVSSSTRERVLDAAKRLGYQPNAVARSLRRGRTGIIGLYSSYDYNARNDFLGTLLAALLRSSEAQGLDLLLHTALNGRSAADMFAKLSDGRIDGLILHAGPEDPLVGAIVPSSLPVVSVADPLPRLPCVAVDDADGIRQSIAYLWSRGHRRFAYICPDVLLSSVERRRGAFEDELDRRGVRAEDRLVIRITWECGEEALCTLIEQGYPVAVCCWNDGTAYRLIAACLGRSICVPSQVAVMGFDGFVAEKLPARQLTTIRCPWDKVGVTALDMLLGLIEGKDNSLSVPKEIRLPVKLLEGDTV